MTDSLFACALQDTLEREYGLTMVALVRRRTVFGVVAEDGQRYVFKPLPTGDGESRLQALAKLESVFAEASAEAALPTLNRRGEYVVRIPYGNTHAFGYLQPWLRGRHVDVAKSIEREAVMQSLARFQRASQDAGWPAKEHLERGSLLHKFRVKQRALERIWPQAQRFLPQLTRVREDVFTRMSSAIHRYSSHVIAQRGDTKWTQAFCHRDLAPHNVLWQQDGAVAWIDFDHAGYDDMLHDAMQFTSHCVYLGHLSQTDFNRLLTVYADEAMLSADRLYLLRDLTLWPDILIRAMIEWCRADFPPSGKHRVLYALRQERLKQQLTEHAHVTVKRLNPS